MLQGTCRIFGLHAYFDAGKQVHALQMLLFVPWQQHHGTDAGLVLIPPHVPIHMPCTACSIRCRCGTGNHFTSLSGREGLVAPAATVRRGLQQVHYLWCRVCWQLPMEVGENAAHGVVLGDLVHLIQYEQADHAQVCHPLLDQRQVQAGREEEYTLLLEL